MALWFLMEKQMHYLKGKVPFSCYHCIPILVVADCVRLLKLFHFAASGNSLSSTLEGNMTAVFCYIFQS